MELRDITMDDLPMYERSLTDPDMMSELGWAAPQGRTFGEASGDRGGRPGGNRLVLGDRPRQ